MSPTPDHLDDEILSALLDEDAGGADGAAVDAAAHLRACERCADRQAELAGARAALAAAPVEPLDELTRRRLVAGALQAAVEEAAGESSAAVPIGRAQAPSTRSRWAQRHPAVLGSAAAVVLAVLVGVPFVLGNDKPQSEHTAVSALAPEAAQESAAAFLGDLGDLTDRDNLRLRLSGAAGDTFGFAAPLEPGPSPAAGAPAATPVPGKALTSGGLAGTSNGASATTASPPAAGGAGSARSAGPAAKSAPERTSGAEAATADDATAQAADRDRADRDRADTDACVAALLNGPARGGRLTRSGTGTYRGRPAIVAAFELSGGTVAFVADRSGCGVLDRFAV